MHGTIKVRKIGNSIGIIIPQFVAQEMKIRKGSYLKMTYYENNLNLSTGPTDREKWDQYISEILRHNEEIANGVKPR